MERYNFTICCGKDVCRIIIDRIRSGVNDRLRKDRKDIDKEEGRQNKYLYCGASLSRLPSSKQHYLNFIKFKIAFDSIYREKMWSIMKEYGVP